MPSSFQWMLLATLAVAMVTAAPVANEEELVDVKQGAQSVDRAKRADEEIVFGNQQNKARVISKKSDLSNILTPTEPQGELDQGSEVIVHQQRPMDEEMVARVEAAEGDDKEKMDEAVEAAMETVASTESGEAGQGEEAEDDVVKQLVAAEVEDGAGNVSQVAEEEEEEDEDLKDLQEVVGAASAASQVGGEEGSSPVTSSTSEDDVDKLLHNLQKEGENEEEEEEEEEKDKELAEYYQKMYQYMMMPYVTGKNLQGVPYYYYRRRRSLAVSKNAAANGNNKRARRIKRDLLDDTSYDPYDIYNVPYLPEDTYEPVAAPADDYVPLTDDEAEYLYRRLLNYLSDLSYVEETENPYQEVAEVEPYLQAYTEPQEEAYSPYDIYNEESIPLVASPYDDGYPYGPVDLDTYQGYAKRGMVDYYPREEDKRYFFPFSDEPQTHWGAFVPEKRGDYEEAIQRLQRLAMALSDNPGPYYREMLEDYRRK